MPSITEQMVATDPAARTRSEAPAILGHLESDVACRVCGHNLRTRPIRRHPRSGALVCLCPQCRQYNPLQPTRTPHRPSGLSRFMARSLISLWVMLVGVGGLSVVMVQAASTLFILELVTTHASQTVQTPGTPRVSAVVWRYIPKKNLIEYKVLTYSTAAFALAAVAAAAATSVVVFSHWRGWVVALFWLLEPACAAFLICILWRANAPELLYWGLGVIGTLAGLQVAAAFGGAAVGRPAFKLLVRLAVPPDMREMLAQLRAGGSPPAHPVAGSPR